MRAPIARSPEPFGPGTPNLDLSSPSRAPPHACRSNSKRKSNGLKRARLGNRPVIRKHSRRPRGRRQAHAGNEGWDIGLRWVFLQPPTWAVRPPCCSVSNIHQKFKQLVLWLLQLRRRLQTTPVRREREGVNRGKFARGWLWRPRTSRCEALERAHQKAAFEKERQVDLHQHFDLGDVWRRSPSCQRGGGGGCK